MYLPSASAVQLAHPADGRRPVCGFCLNSYGWILLGKFAQRSLKVLAVIISLRTDDHRDDGPAFGIRFTHGALQATVVVYLPRLAERTA
jgi:hypothetical protein